MRSATGSPRASSRSRNPPETIVSTTSLTVPPNAARTDLTSLRRTWAQLHVRCGPTGPTSESEELPSGRNDRAAEAMPRSRSSPWRSVARGARTAARRLRSCSDGSSVRRVSVRTTSSVPLGSGAGSHPGSDFRPGSSSNITDIRSVADTPSTMQ